VQLWHIGTDTSKERLYKRLDMEEPGAGYQHFPRGLPDEYFEQLAAEKLVRRRVRGVDRNEWIKTRERNEALDLKIGCYAVAVYAGLQRVNWDLLERAVNPEQKDLFAPAAAVVEETQDATRETDKQGADAAPAPAVQTNAPAVEANAAPPASPVARPRVSRPNWITGFRQRQ
jgi:phage terminase large subunit GpA-like protein